MNTSELQQALAYLFPSAAMPGANNWSLTSDSDGNASILLWNNSVGTQPTTDQLAAAFTATEVAAAKTAQAVVLQAAYEKARYGSSVSLTVGSNNLSFPTDTATQNNVTGYLVAFLGASDVPTQMPLEDASGAVQMLSYAQLQTLAQSIANESISAFTTYQGLLTSVAAATSVADVQAIVWPF